MKPIAIIKLGETYPDVAARLGGFADWVVEGLAHDHLPRCVTDVTAGASLPAPQTIAGTVLTGAHDMLTDCPAWSDRVSLWLRRVVAAGVPVLGICYGHQLLAHTFGGRVDNNPLGREFGTTAVHLAEAAITDPLFRGLPKTFSAHVCHCQSVIELPPAAVSLAWNRHDRHQAFRFGSSAWGVQFHPEFSEAAAAAYVTASAEDLRIEGRQPSRLKKGIVPTPFAADILPRFGRLVSNAAPTGANAGIPATSVG